MRAKLGFIIMSSKVVKAYTFLIISPLQFTVTVKRLLDQGAQTLMFPYVETPEEAAAAVAATRFPPHGVRGVSGSSRAASETLTAAGMGSLRSSTHCASSPRLGREVGSEH